MTTRNRALMEAAMNAATLARNSAGDSQIGMKVGLTADDLKRARETLQRMPQDAMTSAFDRRDFLIHAGWRPARDA